MILLALIAWGSIELLRLPHVRIAEINIAGARAVSTQELEEVIRTHIAGTYIGLVPRDNSFLYPRRTIASGLPEHFPRIGTIDIARDGMQTLMVTITERQPHALWCGDIVPSYTDILEGFTPQCYFLDETGFLFAQAPSYGGGAPYHRFFGAIKHSKVEGQSLIPEEEYVDLFGFMNAVRDADIELYGLVIVDEVDMELYLSDGARLMVRRDDDHVRVLARIRSVLVSEEFTTYDTDEIEYIDLRFGNRVYFRPREVHALPSVSKRVVEAQDAETEHEVELEQERVHDAPAISEEEDGVSDGVEDDEAITATTSGELHENREDEARAEIAIEVNENELLGEEESSE